MMRLICITYHTIWQDKHKVWLYRDKGTGQFKGDCTVTYEDPFSAASAVEWFNNKEFRGKHLHTHSLLLCKRWHEQD